MFKRDQEKKTNARTVDSSEHDLAKARSQDCPYCHGGGSRTVFHPAYRGEAIGVTQDGRRFVARVSAHCRCTLGVFMRDHAKPADRRFIPWIEDICTGRSSWLLDDPTESRIVGAEPNDPATAESFQIFRRRLAASFRDRDRQSPEAPLCPRCRQPMGGGRGGMPFTCFRSCGRKELTSAPPCPVCQVPMEDGGDGKPWRCARNHIREISKK